MTQPPAMGARALLNPADTPQRQTEKLLAIADVLMRRVEQGTDQAGAAYAQFERAAMLEEQVRARTTDLESALDLLNEANARLARASSEAEAARANLTDALETIQDGFALFSPHDVLILANSRFGALLPDVRARLVPGLRFDAYVDLVSQSTALALPQGVSPPDWAVQRLVRHRDPNVVFTVELQGDLWLQVAEHRTPGGGTVILQTEVTDIIRTERETRGRLLDDQERLVRATLDHLDQGVCIFDGEMRLAGWNARMGELLALGPDRLRKGLPVGAFAALVAPRLGEPDSAAVLQTWIAHPAPRPPLRFEWRRGQETVLDGFAQAIPDHGFVLSITDVSRERRAIAALSRARDTLEGRVRDRTQALERARERAERANATRSRFVAAASHDLLQPLSAAKLFLASATDAALPDAARLAIDNTQAALGSVEALVQALLDISRLESGRLDVTAQPVPLAPLLRQLGQEFAPHAQAKGLDLRLRLRGQVALSDPLWLRRILQNLLSNAVRYTDHGGVLVGIRPGPRGLRIDVADTGCGIDARDAEAIFREFHRLKTRASAAEGMGLGLAIVERAAGMLGHAVSLRSVVGRGSRFSLHLAQAEGPSAPPPALPGLPTARDRIALVVAPDATLRHSLSAQCEGAGLQVLDLASLGDARDLLDEIALAPDLILLDEACAGFEALLDAAHSLGLIAPVRVMSSARDEGLHRTARAQGTPLVLKPLDGATLERMLAGLGG